jgi:hypothetical protein
MTIIAEWTRHWIETPGDHKIRYACPETGCDAFFDVTPGTSWALRDELALRHMTNHLLAETTRFLQAQGGL